MTMNKLDEQGCILMRGIAFNGQHSYTDLGLTIASKNIGNPSKLKRKERVPFSNTDYDFSGIYGGQEYTERELTYTFNVLGYQDNKDYFTTKKIEALNWLMSANKKGKLTDDTIEGYHFLAEVEDSVELIENEAAGTLTATFTAYPFKISDHCEGDDIWDTFNFLLDYAQVTEFNVSGATTVTLYNNGANNISPTIQASSPMKIVKG